MTYSIIARDSETGQFGVAVQTFNLGVGSWVPWAEGGVGAVATQALADRGYGTHGLDLIRGGKSAADALTALLAVDDKREFRQVAMIDEEGRIAQHTGKRCFPEAGCFIGDTFCTQANMMRSSTVWTAMADAYRAASGDFAARLMATLDAAQAEGGDMRGKQTAAILIVDSKRNPIPLVSLRVDYDPKPLEKLNHMVRLHRAYTAEYTLGHDLEAGDIDAARAKADLIGELAPDEPYLVFLRALHLTGNLDRWEAGLKILQPLVEKYPVWREYLEREAKVDNFGNPGLGKRLLEALDRSG
jgi:uncharacterized Ntn-hydrolase superfamily protein